MKRGLWVEAESSFFSPGSKTAVDKLFSDCSGLEVTSIYLQVHRRGYAWYSSRVADRTPILQAGFDPLRYAIEKALAAGIELHAWINCCNLGVSPSASVMELLGPESLVTDSLGNSIRDYKGWSESPHPQAAGTIVDTPGAWVDPSAAAVRSYLGSLVEELGRTYPELSGVHLDFIRYPYALPMRPGATIGRGVDFGYGAGLAKFHDETGLSIELSLVDGLHATWKDPQAALSFDAWRRAQLTGLIRSFRGLLPDRIDLSAATLCWTDRAYLASFQDWGTWLQDGYLTSAIPMAYTSDTHHFELMIRQALAFASEGNPLLAGIGCYKCSNHDLLLRQLEVAKSLGCAGSVLFSYGTLLERQDLFEALSA